MEYLQQYQSLAMALTGAGLLMVVQLLTADFAGIKSKHAPGAPVPADHKSFHFRAVRTIGNVNESVAILILFALAGVVAGADPVWLARGAWLYLIARIAFSFCYWFNIKTARSIFFGLSLLGIVIMGITDLLDLIN